MILQDQQVKILSVVKYDLVSACKKIETSSAYLSCQGQISTHRPRISETKTKNVTFERLDAVSLDITTHFHA